MSRGLMVSFRVERVEWSAAYSIVVMIGTVIGALLLGFSFILFILHRENIIIKDVLITCCLIKCGLLVTFGGVMAFLGSPSSLSVEPSRPCTLLASLSVSCVLVKASHTFIVVMSYNPNRQCELRKFDKPFVIIGISTAIQALICIFWLIFDPVDVVLMPSKSQPLTLNRLCTQGSMYGFGAMHVYIALLAIICFLLAFRGKASETEPIIHLFSWLCFIPVYITQEESRPIVQISAIMVSSYGIIFCHFTPKWFKILTDKAETQKTTKPPVSPPSDSGVISNLGDSVSTRSLSQAQLSIADSDASNWDITSLKLSDITIASFRRRRIRRIRFEHRGVEC